MEGRKINYVIKYVISFIMRRRSLKEKNIRKLTRLGRSSLGITIPIEMIRYLGWRERQKVVVKRRGKKLTVEDWKRKSKR